jgi:hypothetical protein
LIVGFAAAVQEAMADRDERHKRLGGLRDQLWNGLNDQLPAVERNGAATPRLAHNLNITLPGMSGSRLHRSLRSPSRLQQRFRLQQRRPLPCAPGHRTFTRRCRGLPPPQPGTFDHRQRGRTSHRKHR